MLQKWYRSVFDSITVDKGRETPLVGKSPAEFSTPNLRQLHPERVVREARGTSECIDFIVGIRIGIGIGIRIEYKRSYELRDPGPYKVCFVVVLHTLDW